MKFSIKSVSTENLESDIFRKLAAKADVFEGYQHPHAERIARIADELGKILNLATKDRQSLRAAALLHDLGESSMNRDYIKRAGSLNEEERLDLARHPIIGEREAALVGADRATQLLVRWHHEWWNGAGYPDALRREQIPLAARVLRIADSYAAITDVRSFRPPMTQAEAQQHLIAWAGVEFDPRLVTAFLALDSLKELESFATAEAEPAANEAPAKGWNLFATNRG